ncbi:MAG TPA: hypothetical protein VJ965_10970, partial [Anaerolineales bacterium]|nr:hypothetical protein [Anaerolineales bacterium]
MTEDKNKKRQAALSKLKNDPGMLTGLSRTVRLVLRLLGDSRVNFFLKLLPISTLVYLISPLDAVIPVVDDALIMGLGTYVFIELCPQDIVEEHRARLAGLESQGEAVKEST